MPTEPPTFDPPDRLPALVPARMVNEYAYCPRLFFLEWVESRFADNADTVEGRYEHRAVDRERGAAPSVDDDAAAAPWAARSVLLSSEELGLVARIDVVEADGRKVWPVDTKRGSPPDIPEGAWEPERVQLCVQALLLREHGHVCEEGYLWFAGARRRVRVVFDDALVARTLRLILDLRENALRDTPPLPLVDSPKCPRCSLVGICLPDETNALLARQELPLRRILPSDPTPRPLYVTEQGTWVRKSGGRIEVTRKDEVLGSVRALDVSQLCVFGNVQVSTQLLRDLFATETPVIWFSYGGWFSGIAEGLPGKNVELRRRQVALAGQGGLAIARAIVAGKIRNARVLLRRNAREPVEGVVSALKGLAERAGQVGRVESLLGVEGTAARLYFERFPSMLREDLRLPGGPFQFEGRNRRPPRDAVNCLLSFVYALLVKDLTTTLRAVGFDPYLGFYHRPRFGRPALALDLAEEFRPLIAESVVLTLINNGEVAAHDFTVRAGGVALTPGGRRAVLSAYERRLETEVSHPVFGYRLSYRRVLDVQARLLAAHVLGEIPGYTAFVTR